MRRINHKLMDGVKVYNTKVVFGIAFVFVIFCGITMLLYEHIILRFTLLAIVCAVFVWKRQDFIALFRMMKAEKKKK